MIDLLVTKLWNLCFRGKYRLLNMLVPAQGIRSQRVFGFDVELNIEDWIQRHVYLGTFEPWETQAISKHLKRGMCFVDVGANIGYFSLLASEKVGESGKVFAIEPTPILADHLENSIDKNNIRNIRVVKKGLSDFVGKTTIYLPPEELHNNTPSMLGNEEGSPLEVDVVTLDSLMQTESIESIDLLKIDVEGMESKVIAGGEQSFREKKIKAILVEFNDYWLKQAGSSPEELFHKLTELGFVADVVPDFPKNCVENVFLRLS